MKRFWDFAESNPFITLLIIGTIAGAIVKIITGADF